MSEAERPDAEHARHMGRRARQHGRSHDPDTHVLPEAGVGRCAVGGRLRFQRGPLTTLVVDMMKAAGQKVCLSKNNDAPLYAWLPHGAILLAS
jgi:hypothetical protein